MTGLDVDIDTGNAVRGEEDATCRQSDRRFIAHVFAGQMGSDIRHWWARGIWTVKVLHAEFILLVRRDTGDSFCWSFENVDNDDNVRHSDDGEWNQRWHNKIDDRSIVDQFLRRLKTSEGEITHLSTEENVTIGECSIFVVDVGSFDQIGIVEDMPVVDQSTEHHHENEQKDAKERRNGNVSRMHDGHQTYGTRKNNETNGPWNEDITTTREHTE